jgi:hypothetical protein
MGVRFLAKVEKMRLAASAAKGRVRFIRHGFMVG